MLFTRQNTGNAPATLAAGTGWRNSLGKGTFKTFFHNNFIVCFFFESVIVISDSPKNKYTLKPIMKIA